MVVAMMEVVVAVVAVVRSRSWCSMVVVRSRSWCSMMVVVVVGLTVVVVARVKHDTTHLADHR